MDSSVYIGFAKRIVPVILAVVFLRFVTFAGYSLALPRYTEVWFAGLMTLVIAVPIIMRSPFMFVVLYKFYELLIGTFLLSVLLAYFVPRMF